MYALDLRTPPSRSCPQGCSQRPHSLSQVQRQVSRCGAVPGASLQTWTGDTMIKRRGNPNWGKAIDLPPAGPRSFETIVKSLGLRPHQYEASTSLRDWVLKNKHNKYVPQDLLQAWGMSVPSEVSAQPAHFFAGGCQDFALSFSRAGNRSRLRLRRRRRDDPLSVYSLPRQDLLPS